MSAIGLAIRFGKFILGNPILQVILFVLAAYAFGQWQGRNAAWEQCEARVKAEVAAEQARQKKVGDEAMAALKKRLDQAEADETEAQKALLRFEAEIASRPKIEACSLSEREANEINR